MMALAGKKKVAGGVKNLPLTGAEIFFSSSFSLLLNYGEGILQASFLLILNLIPLKDAF